MNNANTHMDQIQLIRLIDATITPMAKTFRAAASALSKRDSNFAGTRSTRLLELADSLDHLRDALKDLQANPEASHTQQPSN